eukprot:14463427-Alexandrium_andersonii.AAC.1
MCIRDSARAGVLCNSEGEATCVLTRIGVFCNSEGEAIGIHARQVRKRKRTLPGELSKRAICVQ